MKTLSEVKSKVVERVILIVEQDIADALYHACTSVSLLNSAKQLSEVMQAIKDAGYTLVEIEGKTHILLK